MWGLLSMCDVVCMCVSVFIYVCVRVDVCLCGINILCIITIDVCVCVCVRRFMPVCVWTQRTVDYVYVCRLNGQ